MPRPSEHARRRRSPLPAADGEHGVREDILAATRRLLADTSYSDLRVQDILTAAGVARGSFYFYFADKHDVLAELVRRAVAGGHESAAPWLHGPTDKIAALRAGITAGARLWQDNAGVLRAIVENWRSEPRLTQLWLEQMDTFTEATRAQIAADRPTAARLARTGLDPAVLAASLTWLGERLYYLAAAGVPPFDDQQTLIDTLMHHWTGALYGRAGSH